MIGPDQHFILLAFVLAFVAIAVWAEQKTRLGRNLSAPAIIIIGGIIFSNTGIVPKSAAIYGGIFAYVVPAAIAALLLKADLRKILSETGTMALPFLLSAVSIIAGGLIASLVVNVGPEEHKLAGTMVASSIGGSMNFVAVSNAMQFEDQSLLSAALATDSVVGASYLVLMSIVSATAWFVRRSGATLPEDAQSPEAEFGETHGTKKAMHPLASLTIVLALSAGIAATGEWLAGAVGFAAFSVLAITVMAVAVANIFSRPLAKVRFDAEFGSFGMYLFFFAVAALTDLSSFIENAGPVMAFVLIMIGVHVALVLLVARALRWDLAEVFVAANACVLGPATAAGLAGSRGWQHLVTPGIMCGLAGYVTANFIGLGLAQLLQ